MIYTCYLDATPLLDVENDITLQNAKLELADCSAGSFHFGILPDNPCYRKIKNAVLTGIVKVMCGDEILFQGRITTVEQDFYGALDVVCEGELAFLADSIQRPAEYHSITVRQYLENLVALHNDQVEAGKRFEVGSVTVTDSNNSLYRYTNWESTLEVIQSDLVESLGGHLRVRYQNGKRYLDYLADYPRLSAQKIEFGENLLDYTEMTTATDLATVCIPLGAKLEESPIEALEARQTITDVNSGKDYIEVPSAVSRYGRIARVVTWDDVHTPAMLLTKGQNWLKDNQYEALELNLTAIDLQDFGFDTDHLRLLDRVRCTSAPHGMDREFPISTVSLDLLNPDQNKYTLGTKAKGFAKSTSKAQASVTKKIEQQPSKNSILKSAQDNATNLITMVGKDGHVIFSPSIAEPNELYITDADNLTDARRVWRWNVNGLGYSSNGVAGPFDAAITMDGHIVGSVISAGTVQADALSVQARATLEKYTDDALKSYWTAVETQSAIDASAKGIELSVTDRLMVRDNLLTNTRNPQNADGLYGEPGSSFVYNQAFRENAFRSYVEPNNELVTSFYTSTVKFRPNTTYCLSFDYNYIFAPFTVTAFLEYLETETSTKLKDDVSCSISLNAGTSRAHVTFTTPNTIYEGHLRIKGVPNTPDTVARNIYFNKIKLEEGSAPTAYDVNTSTLVNQSSLKIMSDKIESRITSADAESLIEQKADSIRVRAKKLSWSSANSSMSSEGTLKCENAEISGTMRTGYSSTNSPGITLQNGVLSLRPTLTAPASATIEYSSPYWETYYTSSGEGGDMVTDGKTPDNRAASIKCLRSFFLDVGDIYIKEGSEYGYPIARRGWTGSVMVGGKEFKFIRGICVKAA